jgi:hypothetical protein
MLRVMWLHRLKMHELNAFCTEEVELPLKLLMNHEVSISADSLSLRLFMHEFAKTHKQLPRERRLLVVRILYWM